MFIELTPSQRVTVIAVGEYAYRERIQQIPAGIFPAELVMEPDNPYDDAAISVRYHGAVIGYLPVQRTATFWQTIARVQATRNVAVVKAVHRPDRLYPEIGLYLLAGERALPPQFHGMPDLCWEQIPPAYRPPAPGEKEYRARIYYDGESHGRPLENPYRAPRKHPIPEQLKLRRDPNGGRTVSLDALLAETRPNSPTRKAVPAPQPPDQPLQIKRATPTPEDKKHAWLWRAFFGGSKLQ